MLKCNNTEMDHSFPAEVSVKEAREGSILLEFMDKDNRVFYGEIAFYLPKMIRVRLFLKEEENWNQEVICEDAKKPLPYHLVDLEEEIHVEFSGYWLIIGKSPYSFRVLGTKSEVLYEENLQDVNSVNEGFDRIPPMGFTYDENGTVVEANIAPKLYVNEHIYGLGEHFTEFDKRGQSILMRNFDTLGCRDSNAYKNIPFYISSRGYGMFVNDAGIFPFETGSRSVSSISIRVPAEKLEYYLIFGNELKEILSSYVNLTGPAALPPKWSFGLWYSTGFKGNSRENVEQDTALFQKHEIPLSVMHFDCYWLREDMWCDFVWDDAQYPNRKEMLLNLAKEGMHTCLWINPYVAEVSEMFQEGKEKGYLVKNQKGEVYTADLWHGLLPFCGIVDFTNPDAVVWYQGKIRKVLEEGVDVLKTDFAEDIPEDSVFFDGRTGKEMRNLYSRLYNQAVFSVTKEVKGEENGIVWARSGCAGMQQFPVCWSGDPYSSYEGMAATLRGGLSLAMSGVLFWSHDMGGFYGDVSEDIFLRWSQFGLFSSHSRLHGTTTRQPWAYGEHALTIMKKFIQIRQNLMPYILKTAEECVTHNVSFIRPLILEHPYDPAVATICDEYYFGNDMLVCPVFGGDNTLRNIYLPKGEWTDYLTGETYIGEQWIKKSCPLDYMPIFYKGNIRPGGEVLS